MIRLSAKGDGGGKKWRRRLILCILVVRSGKIAGLRDF